MLKQILASGLLAFCLNQPQKETPIMQINTPPSFEKFQQLLQPQANQQIAPEQLRAAQTALNTLPQAEQIRALDYLEQQVRQYGNPEAQQLFSLNPELKLADVISALPPQQVPDWLRDHFQQNPLLNVQEFKQLPAQQQQDLLPVINQALDYYEDLSAKMRSGVNHATESLAALERFLSQARPATSQS